MAEHICDSDRSPRLTALDRHPGPSAPSGPLDCDLMQRIRQGDEAALRALLNRYWERLVRYADGFLNELDLAEDVVQEAFVRVWRSRANWTPTGTVQAYLYRIIRNLALQELEKRGVRDRWKKNQITPISNETPAEHFDREQMRVALQEAIDSLSPRRREIVILARFHGFSYKEIGELMEISPQTVANQMSSALRLLRGVVQRPDR